MNIGLGIGLMVVGAILVWALNLTVPWIDIDLVGYIFMGAGLVITVLGVVLLTRKHVTETRTIDPDRGAQVTRRRNSIDGL